MLSCLLLFEARSSSEKKKVTFPLVTERQEGRNGLMGFIPNQTILEEVFVILMNYQYIFRDLKFVRKAMFCWNLLLGEKMTYFVLGDCFYSESR